MISRTPTLRLGDVVATHRDHQRVVENGELNFRRVDLKHDGAMAIVGYLHVHMYMYVT